MTELRFITAGESHGRGLVSIVEGMVAGLPLDEASIDRDLKRRQSGYGRGPRMSIEQDHAEILSGVRHGLTMGSPVSLLIWNKDWDNWKDAMAVGKPEKPPGRITRPRPGHADLAGAFKYGLRDIRPVLERSSARETASRVACGAVARRFLKEFGIEVRSHTVMIGNVPVRKVNWDEVEASPVRAGDVDAVGPMMAAIDAARDAGDTLGGEFEVVVTGVPVGLGSYVQWDRRLDGRLAQAVMSIPSVKSVHIGAGMLLGSYTGSETHDIILKGEDGRPWRRATNRAGGIEGGVSNGEPIHVWAVVKPVPTTRKPLTTVDLATGAEVEAHYERSDICIVPAAGVIAEAMTAFVLAAAMLEKFGGDHIIETRESYSRFLKTVKLWKADEA
jgi:chorismate synthase